jgi:hypothetical protein
MSESEPASEIVQSAQSTLMKVQMRYRDTTLPFWALAVAWEATRFAWYVVQGDLHTAQDKLHRVEEAIGDFKRKTIS